MSRPDASVLPGGCLERAHHVAEAPAGGILEGYTGRLGPQNPLDVFSVVQLVIEAGWYLHGPGVVAILNDDQVVGLEERSPLLQEVQVPDGGYDDVQVIGKHGGHFLQGHSWLWPTLTSPGSCVQTDGMLGEMGLATVLWVAG